MVKLKDVSLTKEMHAEVETLTFPQLIMLDELVQRRLHPERCVPDGIVEKRAISDGYYQLQYISCGKTSCKSCIGGKKSHGPYWYKFWTENGRKKTKYLGKKLTEGI